MKARRLVALLCTGVSVLLTLSFVLSQRAVHDHVAPVERASRRTSASPPANVAERPRPTRLRDVSTPKPIAHVASRACDASQYPLAAERDAVAGEDVSERFRRLASDSALEAQLQRHAARVCKRYDTQRRLWAVYLKPKYDEVVTTCQSVTPECSLFDPTAHN